MARKLIFIMNIPVIYNSFAPITLKYYYQNEIPSPLEVLLWLVM